MAGALALRFFFGCSPSAAAAAAAAAEVEGALQLLLTGPCFRISPVHSDPLLGLCCAPSPKENGHYLWECGRCDSSKPSEPGSGEAQRAASRRNPGPRWQDGLGMGCRNRRIVCNVLSGYSETWAASLVGFRCAEDWRGWTWLENSLHASVAFLTAPELGPRVDPVQQANQGFELALLVEEPGGLVVLLRGYLGNVVTETWLHVTGKPSQNTYLVISCISISLSVNYPTLLSQRFWGATLLSLEFIHCSTLTLVLNILTHFCHHLQFCLVYSHRIMFFYFIF